MITIPKLTHDWAAYPPMRWELNGTIHVSTMLNHIPDSCIKILDVKVDERGVSC